MAFFFKKMAKIITTPKKEVQKVLKTAIAEPTSIIVKTRHGKIPVFVYKPTQKKAVRPGVYLNLHGGGFVMKYARQDDLICKYLAEKLNCIVFNPDYETAPHHPFPIPPDQCFDVYQWMLKEAESLGGDINKIAIGGQSAGGNMSVGVCMRAVEAGLKVPQMLVMNYPPTNAAIAPATKKSAIPKPLISPAFEEMMQLIYLKKQQNWENPLASPLLYPSLSSLPKTVVITAAFDTLLEEGKAFAEKVKADGGTVAYKEIEADHFYTHAGPADKAKACLDYMVEQLNGVFMLENVNY